MPREYLLTILIPTMPGRESELKHLVEELTGQINKNNYSCTIKTLWNDGVTKTIGAIRNEMLAECKTKYSVFFDDDDKPSTHYVESIMNALHENPNVDAIGFIMDVLVRGNRDGNARISNEYDDWFTAAGVAPYKYCRTINHVAVVKTELARKAGFPDQGHGEDYEYSKKLKPLLQNCITINDTLYYYYFEPSKKPV